MTDVRLFHTNDGGDIELAPFDGTTVDLALDTGLETAAYLSMFGGNERGHGHDDSAQSKHQHGPEWWGNIGEPEVRHMKSETQHMVRDLPATSGNLLRLEEAAKRDLAWFVDEGIADSVDVNAVLSAVDKVTMEVEIRVDNKLFAVAFEVEWSS